VRVALAILLNLGLLAVLLPWLRQQWRSVGPAWRVALLLGLGGRLLVAAVSGLHLIKDGQYMANYGRLLAEQAWTAPAAAWQTLIGNELHFLGADMVYYGMSNTLFFIKVLAFLNLASLGANWLTGIYLGLFSFVGCWQLARTLCRVFPHTPAGAGLIAFVLWPTVLFWATGITKEAAFLGSGAWLTALFIRLFFGRKVRSRAWRVTYWVAMLALTVVHFKMRYFFAVPLLGCLVGLALLRLLQRLGGAQSRWLQTLVLVGVLAGGAWLASEVSVAFRLNKFTNQVVRIYARHYNASQGRPHFEYPDLRPTTESILYHAPMAVVNAVTRPWLGESRQWRYVAGGIENAVLLALLVGAMLAAWYRKSGWLPYGLGLALVIQCLALAVLLGLSTPNLGSLSRYRSELVPFMVLLLLQNDYAAALLRRVGLGSRK
jgi:hypothetical protein